MYISYWYFQQSQCLSIRNTYSTTHTWGSYVHGNPANELPSVSMRQDGTECTPLLHPLVLNIYRSM